MLFIDFIFCIYNAMVLDLVSCSINISNDHFIVGCTYCLLNIGRVIPFSYRPLCLCIAGIV